MTSKKERTTKKKPKVAPEEEKATEKVESPQEPVKEPTVSEEEPTAIQPQLPPVPKDPFESFAYPFRMLVSPLKAFQRIAAHPDFKGFIVIIALLLVTSAAVQYSVASKLFLNISGQPTSLLSTSYITDILLNGMVESVILFLFDWIIFAGALLLIATLLGTKGPGWRTFFVMIGYVFILLVIRTAITAALYFTLPPLNLNFSTWPPVSDADKADYLNQANTVWGSLPVVEIFQFVNWAVDAWLAILATVGVRVYHGVKWTRAAMIAVTAYLIYLTVRLFLGLGF